MENTFIIVGAWGLLVLAVAGLGILRASRRPEAKPTTRPGQSEDSVPRRSAPPDTGLPRVGRHVREA